MKILSVMTIATVAAASVWATEAPTPNRRVTVCIEVGNHQFLLTRAKTIAEGMFAEVGVKIDWHRDYACPREAIRIDFSEDRFNHFPRAYAYALPYEGTHIRVFFDRLQEQGDPERLPALLAHVLVHEIAHILQGVSRHSDSGVMKAFWTAADYSEMGFKPLHFTQTDVDLINFGLDARASRKAAGASTPSMIAVP